MAIIPVERLTPEQKVKYAKAVVDNMERQGYQLSCSFGPVSVEYHPCGDRATATCHQKSWIIDVMSGNPVDSGLDKIAYRVRFKQKI